MLRLESVSEHRKRKKMIGKIIRYIKRVFSFEKNYITTEKSLRAKKCQKKKANE